MSPENKKKKVNSNRELENTDVDFITLNYPESINTYDTVEESERENDFSTDISENHYLHSDLSPSNIFAVLYYLKGKIIIK